MGKFHILSFLVIFLFPLADSFKPGCNVLGCFSNEGIIKYILGDDDIQTDYNARSPDDIDTTFKLFTSKNPYKSIDFKYNLERSQLDNSPFDAQKKVKFIIHGWLTAFDANNWMGRMKDLILESKPDEYNVFAVDWSKATKVDFDEYDKSCVDGQVVGASLAHFINKLHEFSGLKFSDVHLIGHSLGAHVAGFAGKRLKTKIGRITGLDPAGPNFYKNDSSRRLDPSDADYVESIHTTAVHELTEGFGIDDPLSHIDFYPNGGKEQPCYSPYIGYLDAGLVALRATSCDHELAHDLLLINPEKLNENCQFVGYQCANYDEYVKGKCTDCGIDGKKCAVLSIFGETDRGLGRAFQEQRQSQFRDSAFKRYYYKVIGNPPYCLHHYGIEIHLAKDSESAYGKFTLNLEGSRNNADEIQSSEEAESFEPGKIHTFLVTHKRCLGSLKKAVIKWNLDGGESDVKIIIDRLIVKYMSNIDQSIRDAESSVMCPERMNENSDGTEINLIPCCDGQDGPEGCRINPLHQTPSMHVDDHHAEL